MGSLGLKRGACWQAKKRRQIPCTLAAESVEELPILHYVLGRFQERIAERLLIVLLGVGTSPPVCVALADALPERPSRAVLDREPERDVRFVGLPFAHEVPLHLGLDDPGGARGDRGDAVRLEDFTRSEEHTSELQSLAYLVCRLLLEKKKTPTTKHNSVTKKNEIQNQ